ncbi:MAG: glutathione S-transferase [Rhodospirillales bacterium]|nr:glutathione S-transferase [Rhodospirillales bacterium]
MHFRSEVAYAPTLVLDDGASPSETLAITTYLDDTKPEKNLIPPAGSIERVKLLELQTFITTEIHQKFIPVFRDYVTEDAKNRFRNMLIKSFGTLDERFADGRIYLTGETFTVADAYLFSITPWVERTHVNISHLKKLWAFQDRVAGRPAVQAALLDEAAAAAGRPL